MLRPHHAIPLAALNFAVIVRQGRDLAGLSQSALALAAGISRDRVARAEQGHGGTTLRDMQAVLGALDRHGVALLANGRVDLAGAPQWTSR